MKVVVHVDGGARGNPGPAAVAAVASSPEGDELGERNDFIGEATNNVAEYRALLLGLELARELGATEVEVVNDSELVARQIGGEYKVKHAGLRPLYLEAMRTLRGLRELGRSARAPRAERTRGRARQRGPRPRPRVTSPRSRNSPAHHLLEGHEQVADRCPDLRRPAGGRRARECRDRAGGGGGWAVR